MGEILHGVCEITRSRGMGKNGIAYCFIRPAQSCSNRSRRVEYTKEKIEAAINKYYLPMNYYTINGKTFGANNMYNALKEYWRVCEKELIGVPPLVTLKTSINHHE